MQSLLDLTEHVFGAFSDQAKPAAASDLRDWTNPTTLRFFPAFLA